ncbi:MAG: SH3 domain-containing protein [Clostridia bacterium]|nr:SH3 domain-containing protein [Clostridia bacterium]
MKRMLCLLLCLLMLPIAIRPAKAAEDETIVRVLLSTNEASAVTVKLSGKYAVGSKTVNGGTVTAKLKNGKITVSHSSAGVLKTSDTSVRLERVGTDDATILTFDNPKHGTRKYYGDFVFYNDGGKLRLLNYVDMHRYLYGVVSGELSDSSKPDFLKTETICAKGFALAEVEARKNKYFDVYDTTTSQLYYGFVAEDKNTIAAVDAVWTQTLRYNGKTVKTYYSTANGGQAITPRIRWGGTANDGAYWFGYDPFDLMGSTKNVVLTIDGMNPKNMNALLYAFLLDRADAKEIVSVDAVTGVYDPDNPDGTARYPSTLAPEKRYDWTLTVKDSAGKQKQVRFSCTPDEVKEAVVPDAAGAICYTVRTQKNEWKLVWGVNSGHRAGLSHRGAGQMVKKGYSYVDVLKFYYRGATLYDENGNAIESTATFDFTYKEGDEPQPTATPTATPKPTATPQPTATPTAAPPPGPIAYDVIVTTTSLNLRSGPATSYAVIGELKLGAILGVLSESGDWLQVYDEASGKTGYVHGDYVSYYERSPQPHWEGVCNADDSNLRQGPSTNFGKYRPLNKGDKVYVYYQSKNWYYIMDRATGQGAFIWKSYITLGAEAPTALKGDANGNGTVTASDASLILQFAVNRVRILDEALLAADYSGDGTVNAADAAAILRHVVGLE